MARYLEITQEQQEQLVSAAQRFEKIDGVSLRLWEGYGKRRLYIEFFVRRDGKSKRESTWLDLSLDGQKIDFINGDAAQAAVAAWLAAQVPASIEQLEEIADVTFSEGDLIEFGFMGETGAKINARRGIDELSFDEYLVGFRPHAIGDGGVGSKGSYAIRIAVWREDLPAFRQWIANVIRSAS